MNALQQYHQAGYVHLSVVIDPSSITKLKTQQKKIKPSVRNFTDCGHLHECIYRDDGIYD